MIYYKDKQNKVFGFEADGSQNNLVTADMVKINADEVAELTSMPETEKTIQQKIVDLENSITERNKREYVKGLKYPTDERFFYSVKKIDKIDADIELLRAEF